MWELTSLYTYIKATSIQDLCNLYFVFVVSFLIFFFVNNKN